MREEHQQAVRDLKAGIDGLHSVTEAILHRHESRLPIGDDATSEEMVAQATLMTLNAGANAISMGLRLAYDRDVSHDAESKPKDGEAE